MYSVRALTTVSALAFAFAAGAEACTHAPAPASETLPRVDPKVFVGRYESGGSYAWDRLEIRPDGRYFSWGGTCVSRSASAGRWKAISPRCILLERPPPPSPHKCDSNEPHDICCLDPAACGIGLERVDDRICFNDKGQLERSVGGLNPWIYQIVEEYPAPRPPADANGGYRYKKPGACERSGRTVECRCVLNDDIAQLDDRARAGGPLGSVVVRLREAVDLRLLGDHEIAELDLYDPSLTSLESLPGSETLRVLQVEAPLRELGDMRRFPSLERLTLKRTHLTSLRELTEMNIKVLEVSSYHRLVEQESSKPREVLSVYKKVVSSAVPNPTVDTMASNQDAPPKGLHLSIVVGAQGAVMYQQSCPFRGARPIDSCGWGVQCSDHGLCSVSEGGKCRAATDADCEQSWDCEDSGRCEARGGVCVRPSRTKSPGNPLRPGGA
jgi:hypothetical protein